MTDLLVFENPVFSTYAFHVTLLVFKMIIMAIMTAVHRIRKGAFVTPEDTSFLGGTVKNDDQDVERVRRAHLNDLENIPIYMVTALVFVLINPPAFLAIMLIRLYTLFRYLHTIIYLFCLLKQPARTLMYFGGLLVNITMCVMIIMRVFG